MATARIWEAIQNLQPVTNKFPSKREKTAPPVKATAPVEPAKGSSKTDEIIVLLSSAAVATLPQNSWPLPGGRNTVPAAFSAEH